MQAIKHMKDKLMTREFWGYKELLKDCKYEVVPRLIGEVSYAFHNDFLERAKVDSQPTNKNKTQIVAL